MTKILVSARVLGQEGEDTWDRIVLEEMTPHSFIIRDLKWDSSDLPLAIEVKAEVLNPDE